MSVSMSEYVNKNGNDEKKPETLENITFTSEDVVPVMPDLMQVQMMGLKRVLLPALARLVNSQERHAGIDNAGEDIINISDTLYREDIMGIQWYHEIMNNYLVDILNIN